MNVLPGLLRQQESGNEAGGKKNDLNKFRKKHTQKNIFPLAKAILCKTVGGVALHGVSETLQTLHRKSPLRLRAFGYTSPRILFPPRIILDKLFVFFWFCFLVYLFSIVFSSLHLSPLVLFFSPFFRLHALLGVLFCSLSTLSLSPSRSFLFFLLRKRT